MPRNSQFPCGQNQPASSNLTKEWQGQKHEETQKQVKIWGARGHMSRFNIEPQMTDSPWFYSLRHGH